MNHKVLTITADEVRAIMATGKTLTQLALDLNCSRTTLYFLLYPEKYEHHKALCRIARKAAHDRARKAKPKKLAGLIRYAGWEKGGATW